MAQIKLNQGIPFNIKFPNKAMILQRQSGEKEKASILIFPKDPGCLEQGWREIAQGRMLSRPVVKERHVFKNAELGLRPCLEVFEIDMFCFQRMKEALGHGMVEAAVGATHAGGDATRLQSLLEAGPCVRATSI